MYCTACDAEVAMMKRVYFLLLLLIMPLTVVQAKQSGRGRMVFKAIEIKGTIQKPEALLFLSRAKFKYKMLDLQIDLKSKVREAIKNDGAF